MATSADWPATRPHDAPLGVAIEQMTDAWQSGQLGEFLDTRVVRLVYRWTPAPFGWSMVVGFVPWWASVS